MTERTDHAAEARAWIDPLEARVSRDYVPRREALAFAQVHATLALVEQQRIANLIAYLSADVIGGGPGSSGAIDDIREALGLT